jgi:hypothetical protein
MKTRFSAVLGALLAVFLAIPAFGQNNLTTPPSHRTSNILGIYDANAYNYQTSVYSGSSTCTGTCTISLYTPTITLADGRVVLPFGFTTVATQNVAIPPITIGNPGSTTQETVTPSSVSGCNVQNAGAAQQGNCTITASFTYSHGRGDLVTSGDLGWQEAMNDAAANGGGDVHWIVDCGIITLSTSGATTTSTCLIPKDFTNIGASVHVTTTVTTSTSYGIGISGTTSAFITACTSLTAGLGCAGFQTSPAAVNGGAGEGDLLITAAGGTASAGALRVKVWGFSQAQSAF